VDHPALADPLETAELGHMKVGVSDLARIVQLDGDLGVPSIRVTGSMTIVLSAKAGHPR